MPPDTNWTGNDDPQVTAAQGNPNYDTPALKYDDANTFYNGAATDELIPIYTPNDTNWTEPNPL